MIVLVQEFCMLRSQKGTRQLTHLSRLVLPHTR